VTGVLGVQEGWKALLIYLWGDDALRKCHFVMTR